MKLVVVNWRPPMPTISGDRLRAWQLIDMLRDKHELTVLTLVKNREQAQACDDMRVLGMSVASVPLSLRSRTGGLLRALIDGRPLQVGYYGSPAMRRAVASVSREIGADGVVVLLARMGSSYLHGAPYAQILDFCDATSDAFTTRSRYPSWRLGRIVDHEEARRLVRWERLLSERFDATTIVSKHDSARIGGSRPPFVVPIHVQDYLDYCGPREQLGKTAIVFSGEMSSFYSETAAKWLVREIMPRVWARIPAASLFIVGANPSRAIKGLGGERVVVTGMVPSTAAYLAGATISVSPMLMGSGLKTKIIQSMALGVPVVATHISNIGVAGVPGKHLLVADAASEFAACIVDLLERKEMRQWIAAQAHMFVSGGFGRALAVSRIDAALEAAVRASKRRERPAWR